MTPQNKFSPMTLSYKKWLKQKRIETGMDMNEASAALGISRKQLEDIETPRNYGCHLDLEIIGKMFKLYGLGDIDLMFTLNPDNPKDSFYKRPRQRQGSSSRA